MKLAESNIITNYLKAKICIYIIYRIYIIHIGLYFKNGHQKAGVMSLSKYGSNR